MYYIDQIINNYSSYILLILAVINLILILSIIMNRIKLNKLSKKYQTLMNSFKNKQIEDVIEDYYKQVKEVVDKNDMIEQKLNRFEGNLQLCIQKVGVVRYNAFDNVGSNLSFAIALLDAKDDGLIINGVYSRESSATYSKPIIGGQSKYTLSAEEMQALELAKRNHDRRVYETL